MILFSANLAAMALVDLPRSMIIFSDNSSGPGKVKYNKIPFKAVKPKAISINAAIK